MIKNKLQWGLLSTARINRAVIPPIRKSKRGELNAVSSRSEEKVQTYAKEWKIERTFNSYEAMLSDPEIDIIYNPLPNSLHTEWTVKAVQAGKHVLCEKPLANTVAEVDAMIAAGKETGKTIAEAFMYRHHPQTLKVKELVDSGAIGQLRMIKGAFSFFLNRPGDIRRNAELGGGSIWDVGSYPVSYCRFIAGTEPEEVYGWRMDYESGVDDLFVGQMRFPGNVYAQFDCGFNVQHRTWMEITGSEGTINIRSPFTPKRVASIEVRQGDQTKRIVIRSGNLYAGEVEDMHDAVLHGSKPRISLLDSRNNVKTIQLLLQSAKEGKPLPTSMEL